MKGCSGNCQQGRACICMPARMGMSQQERDLLDHVRADRKAVVLGVLCVVLALVLFGLLENVPS